MVEWGAEEITIPADLPTQVGYDSDELMAKAEVGTMGVAIYRLRDMEILFDGIPLNTLKRTSMLGDSFRPIVYALSIALGKSRL